MTINKPEDLNKVIGGLRITSYEQLKNEITTKIQMLKNSSSNEYFEFFRGQGLEKYKLECGLARLTNDSSKIKKMDIELQDRFLQEIYNGKVVALEDSINPEFNPSFEKQWKLNFQAQHLGLKTRLLDWSIDWQIGLLFAVENENHFGSDGQFWIFYCPKKWRYNFSRSEEIYTKDLTNIESPYLVNMPFVLNEQWEEQIGIIKAWRQSGRFFVQSYEQSTIPMEENDEFIPYLIKFIIDGKSKEKIKEDLYKDGLSIEWVNNQSEQNFDGKLYRTKHNVNSKLKIINNEIIEKYN